MRIVGFLLAAAALVFVTGCPQPGSTKKPDAPSTPSVTNFDIQQLKGINFKVDKWNAAAAPADDAYLCFSNEATPKLTLVAKDGTLQKRDTAVAFSFTGNKVTIAELGITGKAFAYDKTAKKITITTGAGANEKIVMTKSTDDLSAATADANKVVAKFNAMMGAPKWVGSDEKNKVWQVTKIKTSDVTTKKLYFAFTNDAEITLAANAGTVTEKKADAVSAYTLGAAVLGNSTPTISIADLAITDGKFSWSGAAGSRTAVIQTATLRVEAKECSDPNYATVNGWGTEAKDTIKGLFTE